MKKEVSSRKVVPDWSLEDRAISPRACLALGALGLIRGAASLLRRTLTLRERKKPAFHRPKFSPES
jgi:hypothetical protein